VVYGSILILLKCLILQLIIEVEVVNMILSQCMILTNLKMQFSC